MSTLSASRVNPVPARLSIQSCFLAVTLGVTHAACGQGTVVFNNLDISNGLVLLVSGWEAGRGVPLDQDLNFELQALVGADYKSVRVWLLSDGTAKGINVAPGRFADPSRSVITIPGVAAGSDVGLKISAWAGPYESILEAAAASAGYGFMWMPFAVRAGSAAGPPKGLLGMPTLLVYNVGEPGSPLSLGIALTNGLPVLTITGGIGNTYSLEAVAILSGNNPWQNLLIQTNVLILRNPLLYVDWTAAGNRQRFYRAGTPAAPSPSLVWVSAGTFLMGSPTNEVDRAADEGPQTKVTFTSGFWMSRYLITQLQYQVIMGTNPSVNIGDFNRPVEAVMWTDAMNYCAKMTEAERMAGRLPSGYAYRLPTEAEWEYVARAGTTTRFSYGDDPGYTNLTQYAWYSPNSLRQTHPVGQKEANPWGVYDMYGNVLEFCLDWYGPYPGGSVVDPRGPKGPDPQSGSIKVLRGGHFGFSGKYCRSAARFHDPPNLRTQEEGFRVVLAPEAP